MKVATLIMASKLPLQLERMIKAMEHPCFHFYIHVDKKVDITSFSDLKKLTNVTFIRERTLCNWGGFSFVNAYLIALEEILDSGEKYDFYSLMSGQDYPIKPIQQAVDFLSANKGKNFISYDREGKKDWWAHAVTRFEKYHFTDLRFKGKYVLQNLVNFLAPKRTFPLAVKLYGSSDSTWWTITEASARYLIKFKYEHVELFRFLKYTWVPDEFLIATILMDSPFKDDIVNNNLRLITWRAGSPNPIIFRNTDFNLITNSPYLFARKFDSTVDYDILNELDIYLRA
ncbi:hypothetical protein ACVWYG_000204 [Pedobacter sp. UYEF25]